MTDPNKDWTKKYLDELNRKIAESKKNGSSAANESASASDKPKKEPVESAKQQDHRRSARHKDGRSNFNDRRDKKPMDKKPVRVGARARVPETQTIRQPPGPRPRVVMGQISWIDDDVFTVWCDRKEYRCSAKSVVQQGPLFVGDNVRVAIYSEERCVIEKYEPRLNCVIAPYARNQKDDRVLAANVNQILLVFSVKEPVLRTDWLDRHIVACEKKGFKPVLCCTKIDLADDNGFLEQMDLYKRMGYRTHHHSSILPSYTSDLKTLLKGKSTVVTGPVGSGKTDLVRTLLSEDGPVEFDEEVSVEGELLVGEYVPTRQVRAYRLEFGGTIIDTPGIVEYELYGIPRRDLKKYFREFRLINNQCASPHCLHSEEAGCKVREAVQTGEIAEDRYQSYLKILEALA
jgi:ribosome biogenesis GTPase